MKYEDLKTKYLLIVSPFYWDKTVDNKDFKGICQQAYAIILGYVNL